MPWTLLLGGLARLIEDPGQVLLLARLLAASTTLLALAVFVRAAAPSPGQAGAALGLGLSTAALAGSGVEFRYDAALMLGLLGAATALLRGGPRAPWALGLCCAWLGAHGLKGAMLGVGALGLGLLMLPGGRARALGAAGLGALGWVMWVIVLGLGGDLWSVYADFAALGLSATRVGPLDALGGWLRRDLWALVLGVSALGAALVGLARDPGRRSLQDTEVLLLAFAGLATLPILTHPHPWPYMLALPVPPLVALTARQGARLLRGSPLAAVGLAAGAVGLGALVGSPPLAEHARALQSPRAPLVADLRQLRALARAGDRVVDPTGLAWFLPPCDPDWYADTLFREEIAAGRYMRAGPPDPARCPWALWSPRLKLLPEASQQVLFSGWAPVGGALLLAREDARWEGLAPAREPAPVENWW